MSLENLDRNMIKEIAPLKMPKIIVGEGSINLIGEKSKN